MAIRNTNSATSRITIPYAPPGNFTLVWRMVIHGWNSGDDTFLVVRDSSAGDTMHALLYVDGNAVNLYVRDEFNNFSALGTLHTSSEYGAVVDVALTWDGSTMDGYWRVNGGTTGFFTGYTLASLAVSGAAAIDLLSRYDNTYPANASISYLHIVNSVLSQSAVEARWNSRVAQPFPDDAAYYPLQFIGDFDDRRGLRGRATLTGTGLTTQAEAGDRWRPRGAPVRYLSGVAVAGASVLRYYRWRNDDGSETTATWAAAENTGISSTPGTRRLRVALTGPFSSQNVKLQVRPVGGTFRDVT